MMDHKQPERTSFMMPTKSTEPGANVVDFASLKEGAFYRALDSYPRALRRKRPSECVVIEYFTALREQQIARERAA
jgi:hypothetical protein